MTQYTHSLGCSITGGVVYRGSARILAGAYLFGDFCSGRVWALVDGMRVEMTEALGGPFPGLVAISPDAFGEVYLTQLGMGRVLRIR